MKHNYQQIYKKFINIFGNLNKPISFIEMCNILNINFNILKITLTKYSHKKYNDLINEKFYKFCKICGRKINFNQKYCSKVCFSKRQIQKKNLEIITNCLFCGKSFTTILKYKDKNKCRKYCSTFCKKQGWALKKKGKKLNKINIRRENNPNWKGGVSIPIKKQCPICTTIFYATINGAKTCSIECGHKLQGSKIKTVNNPSYKRRIPREIRQCRTCKKEFEVSITSKVQHCSFSCWCKNNLSILQEYYYKTLLKLNFNFKMEQTFKDLKNPKTGHRLRIDFYFLDKSLALEIDGEGHFDNYFNSDNFFKSQEKDKLKDEYCIKNNIPIIRIRGQIIQKEKLFDIISSVNFFNQSKVFYIRNGKFVDEKSYYK